MTQTFAGFLHGLKRSGCGDAAVVLGYSCSRCDCRHDISYRIRAAAAKGEITEARAQALERWLEQAQILHRIQERMDTPRDPRDWEPVGVGARIRVAHIEPDSDTGWTGEPA